jgi:hypothetical protein
MFVPVFHEDPPLLVIDDFLPSGYLQKLFADVAALRPHFGIPEWSDEDSQRALAYQEDDRISSLCTGEDLWLPNGDDLGVSTRTKANPENILIGRHLRQLQEFLFHQGVLCFLEASSHSVLNTLKDPWAYKIHIINYGNGGYYNWHCDRKLNGRTFDGVPRNEAAVEFTFALTIANELSQLKGGDQLFMYDSKVLRLPLASNQLVIFPAETLHACTEIFAPDDLPWENRRFNIQAWVCQKEPRRQSSILE